MSRRLPHMGPEESAIADMCDSLGNYLDGLGEQASSLRHAAMPDHPWPSDDNPMLAYLLRRAHEITTSDGVAAAMTWLAVHAWFEGALMDRSLCSGEEGARP